MVWLPREAPSGVFRQIEGLETAAALLNLHGHLARRPRRPWPEAGCQDRDPQLDGTGGRRQSWSGCRPAATLVGNAAAVEGVLILLDELLGEFHVLEHALQLGCVLVAAFALQFRNHTLFSLITDTASCEQTTCQMLLVEILKHILVLQKPEDCHNLLQTSVNLDIAGHALQTLAEHVIYEERQVLCSARVLVQERFESLLQCQLKILALFEGIFHKLVILVLESQYRRDERDRILDLFGVTEDVTPGFTDAINHYPLHFLERLRHPAKQVVHPLQVLDFVVFEHPGAAGVLHVDQWLEMCQNPLLVTELLNLLHRRLMQVILHSSLFLPDSLLSLLEII
mmetsp:Transcript_13328/g.25130  ORF Transcript_13328/g.25130 Transcript_13328/m.25130 type:complete len:340 (-) Transcript_13328:751-1770(-)